MLNSTNDLALDAQALARTVIHFAVEASETRYLTKRKQETFVREFLVMCELGFWFFASAYQVGTVLWEMIEDEFTRFDPSTQPC